MMLIPGQNELSPPSALAVPDYEARLTQFKEIVIAHIAASDPEMATQVAETLDNEAELSTKLIEACVVVMQTFIREINEEALQMFAYWAEDDALDVKASDMGLQRQVIDEGDPDAFPPIEPTYESDEQLRLRYFLAPYSFSNAGPSLSYKYHAMTLDEKPAISVNSSAENQLTVTYTFEQGSFAGQIKDADGIRTEPGRVKVPILSREGSGLPSDALLDAVRSYFDRDDVAVETDTIAVVPAEILPYAINAVVYIGRGPDAEITQATAEAALTDYVSAQHRLGGQIDIGMISHLLYNIGAKKADVLYPEASLTAERHQAPYCQSLSVKVEVL